VRIIAGQFKGRRLKAPTWDGLRPTSDKLRETLFNIVAPRVAGARVLDGYAGTGAIGIEALSRGAAHVAFVERDPRAAALIEANLATCGVTAGYTIERGDLVAVMPRLAAAAPFDLILLDPPYEFSNRASQHSTSRFSASQLSAALDASAERLAPDGLIVLERATRREPDVPQSLARVRDVASGDSTLTFLTRSNR
jgi:16S rRNA (guanine(966)-N(2))-methyltransferase RsmD